ncbi:GH39 family glycosyl hydrolase [Paenibacillus aceti]|uniref:HTH araC/xylS-type domain-containing protein n=1 Tax=Paenibacillus aceti TaxID=1820010 RepID=A0ABQ1W1S9_9BACL|nr:helix-turn-helix domain-containing protein [Paenibacillus aceti]GGG09703.1 hypothetical protein GCM10010913_34430 [Paenibacillus aceti]
MKMRKSIYELVETTDALPFDVSLHSVNYVPSHWHNSVEIIFVLRGSLEVTVGHRQQTLSEGDVKLINSGHVHEVIGFHNNIIATFLIPDTFIKGNIRGVEQAYFECDSSTAGKELRPALDRIRQLLAEMVQMTYKRGEVYELEMRIRMLSVFSILMQRFRTEEPEGEGAIKEKYMDRMLRIINYIEEHYQEPIMLQEIAEQEFLSVPYLSKFFSEQIGLNFQSFVSGVRLKNAVDDMLNHIEMPISEIALRHGFPNSKSFYTAFKNRYHITPNEYRRQYNPVMDKASERISQGYFAFNRASALGIINQYLQRSQSGQELQVAGTKVMTQAIDLSKKGRQLRHTWKNLITIGKAKEGLHEDVQNQLSYLQQHCPFREVRFHGIFDDSMMVYREEEGRPYYNFRFIDQLFDFLLSIGLKPFIELGFMPSELAAEQGKSVFYIPSYVSGPSSMERWCELLDRFLRHCMNRYGREEVEGWKLEFWNEPELAVFWPGTVDEYNEFYLQSYRAVKRVSDRLKIGAPGRIISTETAAYFHNFITFCREHGCLPDFLPIHFYPHEDLLENDHRKLEHLYKLSDTSFRVVMEQFVSISPNPDILRDMLAQEKRMLRELGVSHLGLYLTEWNSTAYHRELTNDTLYKAAYITKNIAENLDSIEGFGYWVLSDNIEETPASEQLFHGGLGLMAQHGIPKAAMTAYELLAKLGDRLLAQGDSYIVTTGRGSYQVLSYNYCHFDDLYALGDNSFINATNRYNGFKGEKVVKLELDLQGIPPGKYRMVTYTVSREQGSSYDAWVRMGAPDDVTEEDVVYLTAASHPRKHIREVEIESGLSYISQLEPHTVELMVLTALL